MFRLTVVIAASFLFACPPSPRNAPAVVSFTASTHHLPIGGGEVTLSWVVADAKDLTIDSGVGKVKGTSTKAHIGDTTTFTLTASNDLGSATSAVTVEVEAQPGVPSFSINPATLTAPGYVTLTYVAKGAQSVSIDQGVGALRWEAGNESVWVDRTTTFNLTSVSPAGTQTKSVTVQVN